MHVTKGGDDRKLSKRVLLLDHSSQISFTRELSPWAQMRAKVSGLTGQ